MTNIGDEKRTRVALISPGYGSYSQPLFEMFQNSYQADFFFLAPVPFKGKLLRVHELAKTTKKYISDHLFFPQKESLTLLLALIKNNYDVVITSCISPQTIVSLLASKITRKSYVLWIEDWFVPKTRSLKAAIRLSLLRLIGQVVLKEAGAIVVEGSPQQRWVENFEVSQDRIFRANISSLDFRTFESVNLRQELNIGNAFVILYVGRIIKQKGLDILIKAFLKVAQDHPNVYLLVCGDGEFRKYCESILQGIDRNHVIFTGWQLKEKAASFYKTADVLVLPSRIVPGEENAEGWGLVINEAMSMSKPIITTDAVGAARDLVRIGVNGYVVRNGSVEELYLALRKIVEDPVLRTAMGSNSRKIFDEFNDYEKMFAGFKKAIEYSANKSDNLIR